MLHVVFVALLLALAPIPGMAQEQTDADLKKQMSAEEFRAAGLDKLSQEELANLNAWLNRKVDAVTTAVTATLAAEVAEKAREEGRQEVVQKNRGFFDFGSDEPIISTIDGEFKGFGKGRQYRLANGQVWEQTDSATLAGVRRDNPEVSIKPGVLGVWYMKVKGYNTSAKVRRIK
ncbi:hypothetical protein CSC70_10405 [Pseudoxanthomonas kalamensis DSM 18571]|nr:hypothetical protein [Pseudoxanthomonas kalamensis]KAF1709231.1 hypothetical protein CSC70_10405 [Pseudoxanthomonas kalamensis DSM 18571]